MTGMASDPSVLPAGTWRTPATHLEVALNHPWFRLLARAQSVIAAETHRFWSARGVHSLMLPVTTGAVSSPMGLGSDSLPITVTLHGRDTHLADSMQFALEFGCRVIGADCFYLMPSFRGEPNDARHLGEFAHSEAELAGDLEATMKVVEEYIRALAGALVDQLADEMSTRTDVERLNRLANADDFEQISFDEVEQLIAGTPGGVVSHGSWRELTSVGEHAVMERLGAFVWIHSWDELAVPFYQAIGSDGRARNADLLFGIGEVVGAGERVRTGDDTRAALRRHGVDADPYEWYARMKDINPIRTSGFGMGIERFLAWVLDYHDIRDMQLLLRGSGVNAQP